MAKIIDITMVGDKELQRKLSRLVTKTQRKIVMRGLRAAGKPVLASAQSKVPVRHSFAATLVDIGAGRLKNSLKLRVAPLNAAMRRAGIFGMQVVTGTREELGIPADAPGYYPISLEFGWTHAKSGLPIPAHSYIRASADEQRANAIGIAGRVIGREIEMEARKR